jgi:hypothetical protein
LQAILYLLAGSLAALFQDHWSRSLNDARTQAGQDRLRLAQFTTTFHLLQASHAQLERQLAGSRTSLRTSMQRLKGHLATSPADAAQPLGGIGAWLLELLAESCNLHAASAYAINDNGLIAPAPAASLGAVTDLSPFNPLLREALSSGRVVSIRANDTGVEQVIAVVPLVDTRGQLHGVISINQMSFIAIQQRTFDLMAIIARQAGDILSGHTRLLADADDGEALLVCLRRSIANALLQKMPLAVVAVKIIEPLMEAQLVAQCIELHRGIDQSWLCHDRLNLPVIVMLMPMPNEQAARSQVQRLREHVRTLHGNQVAAEGLQSFVLMLNGERSTEDALATILFACDIHAPPRNALAYPTRETLT